MQARYSVGEEVKIVAGHAQDRNGKIRKVIIAPDTNHVKYSILLGESGFEAVTCAEDELAPAQGSSAAQPAHNAQGGPRVGASSGSAIVATNRTHNRASYVNLIMLARARVTRAMEANFAHHVRRVIEAPYAADMTLFAVAYFGELTALRASDLCTAPRVHSSMDDNAGVVWKHFTVKKDQARSFATTGQG